MALESVTWRRLAAVELGRDAATFDLLADEPAQYRLEKSPAGEVSVWSVLVDARLREDDARKLAGTILLAVKLHAIAEGIRPFRITLGEDLLDELKGPEPASENAA